MTRKREERKKDFHIRERIVNVGIKLFVFIGLTEQIFLDRIQREKENLDRYTVCFSLSLRARISIYFSWTKTL